MRYYSTSDQTLRYGLKQALFEGLAPDRGLFMPERIPQVDPEMLESFRSMDLADIGAVLSRLLFGEDIGHGTLESLVRDAISFDTPLRQVDEDIFALELFHGPTLAFKDVGARFLARMLAHFREKGDNETHVLVATSGDTGSAVANGFLGVEGIKVHVLYPTGGVTPLQEKQFTTLGQNITALEVNGSFDDCQRLVKEAFMDTDLRSNLTLTSANSINLARFLPQAFYYFRGWAQLPAGTELVFSVPSGNYGNMTAGFVAQQMGLPFGHMISGNNSNVVVPEFLESGTYEPRPSLATIANAMDVGDPSNFVRILDLFGGNLDLLRSGLSAYSFSDDEIHDIVREVYQRTGYLCDPHGATGYQAARDYLDEHPGKTAIFLETAHPAKFRESVELILGEEIEIPERLAAFSKREKSSVLMESDYGSFKAYLQDLRP